MADRELDMVLDRDALNRVRAALYRRRIYPSVSYCDGIRLHVANDIAVRVRSDDVGGLFYRWTDERAGASGEEVEAPADNADDVAFQIAVTLHQTPSRQLAGARTEACDPSLTT